MSRSLTAIRLAVTALVAALALVAGAGTASAETVAVPVPKALVIGAVNTALAGMRVHLDAYGDRHVSGRYLSWLDEDASTVSIPGLPVYRFSAHPEIDKKTSPTRRLRAYVGDIDSTAFAASAAGAGIRLQAMFESGGYEVKIKCLRYRVLKKDWKDECAVPSVLVGKGLQIDNALLTADLTPVAHEGSIAFVPSGVDFDAVIEAGGLCGALDGLCTKLTDYKDKLRGTLEGIVGDLLDREQLRDLVASSVRGALEAAGVLKPDWSVVSVADAGTSWSITVERPDQIDAGSVRIVGFAPKTASVTSTCPVDIGFDASISSEYALSGRAWLVNENGSTSPKLDWSIGKGQTATSTIARAFQGTAGQSYLFRWSKLVVEWKDQQGTVFTSTSAPALFRVTCLQPGLGFSS